MIHLIGTEHGLDLLIVPDQNVTKIQWRKGSSAVVSKCYKNTVEEGVGRGVLLRVDRGVVGDEGLLKRGGLAHAAAKTEGERGGAGGSA